MSHQPHLTEQYTTPTDEIVSSEGYIEPINKSPPIPVDRFFHHHKKNISALTDVCVVDGMLKRVPADSPPHTPPIKPTSHKHTHIANTPHRKPKP